LASRHPHVGPPPPAPSPRTDRPRPVVVDRRDELKQRLLARPLPHVREDLPELRHVDRPGPVGVKGVKGTLAGVNLSLGQPWKHRAVTSSIQLPNGDEDGPIFF
jgi:hypothetical protein